MPAGRRPHRGPVRTCCSPPTRRRRPDFDPSDAADLWDLVNRQDWAICESVQRGMSSRGYRRRLVRADGGRQPRHPPLAAAAPGTGVPRERAGRLRRRGSRRPRQRHRDGAGAGAATRVIGLERFELGHTQRREPRHEPHPAAQLPHPGVRPADPGGVRRLGAPRARQRRAAGHEGRRARPLPAGPGDQPGRLRRRRWTRSASTTSVLDAATPSPSGGRSSGCPRARIALYQRGRRDRARRPRHRDDAGAGRPARRRPARRHARWSHVRDLGDGVEVNDRTRARSPVVGLVVTRRRVDQPGAPRPRPRDPARGHAGAGHLLRARGRRAVRPGGDAAVDLDGRPVLLRLPVLRRGHRQGGPGLRRPDRATPTGVPTRSTRRCGALLADHVRRMLPGRRATGALAALPVHADAGPRLRRRPRARPPGRWSSGSVRGTGSSSPRPSAGCWPTSPSRASTTSDVAAFGLDRPALVDPDYQAHWLV